jgi:dipeptidyl-peptidase 4
MKTLRRGPHLLLYVALGCLALGSRVQASQPLELAQIFGPQAAKPDRRTQLRWIENGRAYTTLEPAKEVEGSDLVRYETASGKRSVLVPARAMTPPGASAPLAVTEHQWSPDEHRVLFSVAAAGARRNDPLVDVWMHDLRNNTLRRLGPPAFAGRILYPEFSPDSRHIAYVAGNNLFVEKAGGAPLQLTMDGSELLLNARGDIAHEEEFGLGKAYLWSPDSRHIAYWQFDTDGVGVFTLVRNTGGQYSTPLPLRYPKPGTTNSAVRAGVVAVDRPGTTWFALGADPRNHYVPRMHWAGNGQQLLLQHENRAQNTNTVLLGDAATGNVRQLFVEKEKTWVLPSDPVHWLPGGAFTWLSERDGWMHLYVISRDGRHAELRTPGEFDVISIEAVDTGAGYVYFTASPGKVSQRYLYRATLTGAVNLERLTPAREPGWHEYELTPGSRWAVHTHSTAEMPPVIDLVRLPSHARQRVFAQNAALRGLLAGTPRVETEFFDVDIGGTILEAWMLKPPDFDASKKYPLLMYVYSEPAGQTVVDRWGGDRHLWHLLLAQRGYLVASVDSRGAASPRGRDWRRSIYGQVGVLASSDQAAALRRMLALRSYIDPTRVGVWGWSGGGAMTLNALFRHPELYSTGIAVASPVDQMLYNSIYQERYMGLPADNAAGYRDGSPIHFAQNLKGNLLIIHGTGDDNVHYQNAEQLVDRLIALNKSFSMMAYPDRTHGIGEGANTRLHLFTLATRYLETHLPPNR